MSTATLPRMRFKAEESLLWTQRPENVNRSFELVRGEVIELPAPTKVHGVVAMNAGLALSLYCRQRGFGYVTSNDSGVILARDPDTVCGPDVALYEDAASFADLHPKYGENPPVLAVEVVSPNDNPGRVNVKLADYLNNGVKLVWMVYYESRLVIVDRPNRNPEVVTEAGELDGTPDLPGLRCPVKDFFYVPQPPAAPPAKPDAG